MFSFKTKKRIIAKKWTCPEKYIDITAMQRNIKFQQTIFRETDERLK